MKIPKNIISFFLFHFPLVEEKKATSNLFLTPSVAEKNCGLWKIKIKKAHKYTHTHKHTV